MRLAFDIVSTAFLALGCLVALTGAVGILRMPDFYTRLHPAGKNDSFAQFLIMVGLIFQADRPEFSEINGIYARLVMITLFIFLTSPVSTHAITRAAHLDGLKIWRKEGSDRVQ
jgi:multicomponent Na+:H+ antiporter subunit G